MSGVGVVILKKICAYGSDSQETGMVLNAGRIQGEMHESKLIECCTVVKWCVYSLGQVDLSIIIFFMGLCTPWVCLIYVVNGKKRANRI